MNRHVRPIGPFAVDGLLGAGIRNTKSLDWGSGGKRGTSLMDDKVASVLSTTVNDLA